MSAHFIWNLDPELIRIGPVAIRWYGLLFATAFVAGLYWMQYTTTCEKQNPELLEPLLYRLMIGALVGARLGHCLFYEPGYYLANPIEILKVWHGGLASHGGVIGLFLGMFLHARRYPAMPLAWLSDRLVVAGAFGGGLIRLGNFANSELVGLPTRLPWGVVFTRYDGMVRHPVQLYESAAYLTCALLLFFAYKKGAGNTPWRITALSLILIPVARMALEYCKTPQAAFDTPLRMGQLLSLPFLCLGIALLVFTKRKKTPSTA